MNTTEMQTSIRLSCIVPPRSLPDVCESCPTGKPDETYFEFGKCFRVALPRLARTNFSRPLGGAEAHPSSGARMKIHPPPYWRSLLRPALHLILKKKLGR